MSPIAHKYTPAETERELEATFAARASTLNHLLNGIRSQIESGRPSGLVITGPPGAGKTTILLMAALRIRQDPALSAAWIPVFLPEDQFDVASLRDLLAATLRVLSGEGSSLAGSWLAKVEGEPDEDQSTRLAITGLGEIAGQAGKRLILVVENLDALLERRLGERMKATLRGLLMTDPFMTLVGSSVHAFDALNRLDAAFFNGFGHIPLSRLTADEVFELLTRRATFDRNGRFLRELPQQRAKVRAAVHLSGGNPRLVLMLYELLSQGQVTTIAQYLRRLVDELTPSLKEAMARLPPQQQRIVHALMEKGGTAQPTDLVAATRLPLNAVTSQLRRLKDAGIVEVLGGGKGRAAHYTVPDTLFAVWYQMRHVKENRRRIESFVEVLRIWFEEEERGQFVRGLSVATAPVTPAESAAVEYFAASLSGAQHQRPAADACIDQFARLDLREAALVHANVASVGFERASIVEPTPFTTLAAWLLDHTDLAEAARAVDRVLRDGSRKPDERCEAFRLRGRIKRDQGDLGGALDDYTAAVTVAGAQADQVARALIHRGVTKERQRDLAGALDDYTAVLHLPRAPADQIAHALFNRGVTRGQQGDVAGEIADYTAVVDLPGAPVYQVAQALFNRGITVGQQGDVAGEITDYTRVVALSGAPVDEIGRALVNRGVTRARQGDAGGALADYTAVIVDLAAAAVDQVARALFNRGATRGQQGDVDGEIADYTAVVNLSGAPPAQVARALLNRGIAKGRQGDAAGEIADYSAAVEWPGAPAADVAAALIGRGVTRGAQGDVEGESADYAAVVALPDAPVAQVARALVNRGITRGERGDSAGEIADYSAVIDLPGAPVDQVVRALLYRGIVKGQHGDVAGAIADETAVVEMPGVSVEGMGRALLSRAISYFEMNQVPLGESDLLDLLGIRNAQGEILVLAADVLFRSLWLRRDEARARAAVLRLSATMSGLPDNRAKEIAVRFLGSLASPELRDAWPTAWRALIGTAEGETRAAVGMFRPVCEVLEGSAPAILDRLPPEERDFARSVLQRFAP